MAGSTYKVRVQWGDCDGARIVFYPNFFRWFDESTRHLFESHGLPWAEMIDRYGSRGLPLVDARATFRHPARFGDTLAIESRVMRWGTRSFELAHDVRVDGMIGVQGRETRIWGVSDAANPEGLKAAPIPAEVKAMIPAEET
ncbi:MAG: acyl-CoA thioesterase [Alphaproteobacteria bacterium]|nr:acyl-CoA thioesterase [Alphaproteobacteria bacterium]